MCVFGASLSIIPYFFRFLLKLHKTVIIPFDMHNGHKIALIKFTSDACGSGRGFDIEYKQVCLLSIKLN